MSTATLPTVRHRADDLAQLGYTLLAQAHSPQHPLAPLRRIRVFAYKMFHDGIEEYRPLDTFSWTGSTIDQALAAHGYTRAGTWHTAPADPLTRRAPLARTAP
ncbi:MULTISPECIES: hypothetical protein [Nocardia]|uniref:hypothetical protein n=1 Tax=Nocardia TaxID=1817 RepID=UPI002458C98E|nr:MULTISPECIES: hypothetical protein [Nocardia]